MTKIEADIRKRIKKFKPFDPEKLKALNDKIDALKYADDPFCKAMQSNDDDDDDDDFMDDY